MDAEELVRILRQGEGPRVEFKQDFPKQVDEVAKEMAAFCE
jgi:predicted HTH transcriptional regulator